MSEPTSVPAPPPTRLLLPPNLASLVSLAAREDGRYAMTGVLLEITTEGYRVCATNGKYLGLIEGPPVGNEQDYPALPGLAQASNGATRGIIPSKAWKEAFKMIPKNARRYKAILNSLCCVLGQNEANFGATDLESAPVYYTRLLEGRFPDYQQVLPKAPPCFTITVNPLQLAELLRVASTVAPADDCKVTIECYTPTTPLLVRASDKGQRFTGVIMPLN